MVINTQTTVGCFAQNTQLPMWLPSGNYLLKITYVGGIQNTSDLSFDSAQTLLTAIGFNIIP